ncbi:MAG: biotin--[acetyl-CoA-carboxylase] ligase [Spirochaetales bacterium]|nr:biotin--[acetyl-CoA-carboxylase] ligase [Spirochaetales bacterium]
MVNKTDFTRKTILTMLRNSSEPLSGEKISGKIGISRVAVWKQIQTLIGLGYEISSSSAGYSLKESGDHLYSWEFDREKPNYEAFRELDSTMRKARELALKGCPDFTTIVAEKQSNGRGRGSKSWDSSEGGLYFTWIIRPDLPLAFHYIYTIGATAVLSRTIADLYGVETSSKWPNDLVSPAGKVAGILTEMECSGEKINWLSLGIGINVNNRQTEIDRTSLRDMLGSRIDRKSLLTRFEQDFRKTLRHEAPQSIRSMWESHSSTIGSSVRLHSEREGLLQGIAMGITSSGALRLKNGSREQTALFGDIYTKKQENTQ